MKKVLFLLFFMLSIPLFSDDNIIKKITIEGLNRTRESVVMELLDVTIGDSVKRFKQENFIQEILKSGIFSGAETSIIELEDGVELNVKMSEKWTLLPLPIASVTGDEILGGLILMESNFLGLRKQFFMNVNYSTVKGLYGGVSFKDRVVTDINYIVASTLYQAEDNTQVTATGGFEWLLNDFVIQSFLQYDRFFIEEEQEVTFLSNKSILIYSDLFYTSTKQSGLYTALIVDSGFDVDNSIFFKLDTDFSYVKVLTDNLYINTALASSFFDSPELLEEYWGGRDNSRTLVPILADQYIGSSIQLECNILDVSWGAFSTLLGYEGGGYQHNGGHWSYYTGPEVGCRVYLKGIAVPALGMDLGYDLISSRFNFSLSMGIGG